MRALHQKTSRTKGLAVEKEISFGTRDPARLSIMWTRSAGRAPCNENISGYGIIAELGPGSSPATTLLRGC